MIRFFINAYVFLIVLDVIFSYLPQLKSKQWVQHINSLSNLVLNPIRRVLPPDLPFDLSPLVFIVITRLIIALW